MVLRRYRFAIEIRIRITPGLIWQGRNFSELSALDEGLIMWKVSDKTCDWLTASWWVKLGRRNWYPSKVMCSLPENVTMVYSARDRGSQKD